MKEYKYKINGNSYKVTIGDIEDNIAHVEVNGTPYKVEMEKAGLKNVYFEGNANSKIAETLAKSVGANLIGINTVEGLSRLANMGDDYYIYDEMTYTIIGERTRKTYRIGDPVRIKVANVNVDLREIDFKILYKLEDRPQNEGEQQDQPFDDIEE